MKRMKGEPQVTYNDVLDIRRAVKDGSLMKQLNSGTFYKKNTSVEEAARNVYRPKWREMRKQPEEPIDTPIFQVEVRSNFELTPKEQARVQRLISDLGFFLRE